MRCVPSTAPRLAALAVAALFVGAGPVSAAAEGKAKAQTLYVRDAGTLREANDDEIKSAAEAKKDPLAFTGLKRYDLGIYTLIVFGALLFILSKYAWPHIAAGLKKREEAIIGARDEAQKVLQEAQSLREKLQRDSLEAAERSRGEYERARKEAEAMVAQARESMDKAAAERKVQAEREIDAAKAEALADIYRQAVDLATTLSSKTLARHISADDHRRLVDEAMAELKQTTKTKTA
jgi:F-type H+-transporting ATPase subunit b